MKKFVISILLGIILFMPTRVLAVGYVSVSPNSLSIQQDGTGTFTITVYNGIGDVTISSSNTNVARVSTGSWGTGMVGDGQTKSTTVTVTGVGVGSATITIGLDVALFDGINLKGQTRTVNVNVYAKPASEPTPTPTPTPSPKPTPTGPADMRSTNTGLSKLAVNGKALNNSNNVYTIEVGNYVDNVNIEAIAADSKAKVSGTGNKTLKVGENEFSVVVTAERGNTTTYVVKVIRKEYNTLNDLNDLLKQNKDSEIVISEKDKITERQLDEIIKSKRKITLKKLSEDKKKVLYIIILDGEEIKKTGEFSPNISTNIDENTKMEEALNYADGIYFDFNEGSGIPQGAILRYFVGDKYKDNDKVNLYIFKNDKVTQVKEGMTITDGYVEFEITDSVKHFISKAKVMNAEVKDDGIDIWLVVSFGLTVFVLVLSILLMKKNNKKNVVSVENVSSKEENVVTVVEPQDTNNSTVDEVISTDEKANDTNDSSKNSEYQEKSYKKIVK